MCASVSHGFGFRRQDETDFDEILASVFEFDAAKLLVRSNAFFKSSWFTAHLADMLGHVGVFGLNDQLRYSACSMLRAHIG